jgi:hypothetical protein
MLGQPPASDGPQLRVRAMSQSAKKTVVVGAIVVVVLAVAGWRVSRLRQPPRVRELAGVTITMLDVAKQTAEVEFVHPKSGRTIRLSGTMAPGCQIFIDGQPARLADVRVGDVATVHGTVYPDYSVQADLVRVTRAGPSTQPAPATTGAAGGS